jgi:hypothetical protein
VTNNLLKPKTIILNLKNLHGIRVGTLTSDTKDFGIRICSRGFAWIKEEKILLVSWRRMDIGLRLEDNLDGATNFSPWKEWIMLLLEENEIWDIVEKTQVVPTDTGFWWPSLRKM